jgi:signal transduction histidine kinase
MTITRQRALNAGVIVLAIVEAAALLAGHDRGRVLAAALAAGGLLALLARSVHPMMASIVALGLLAGSVAAAVHTPTVQFIAVLAAFAIVAASNTTRDGAICLAVGLAFLAAATVGFDPGNALGDFVLTAALCCVMWTAGWQVSRHSRTAVAMESRAHAAEQSKAAALGDERARIARELHDVVSHGLSVVVLQALAARSAIQDADAREAARHLDAVESTARDALGEMRRMLGLLQVGDVDDSGATPSPGLERIPMLVERARSAGLVVDDVGADLSADAPPGVAVAAYRIVQEAFTNAVKHAPGASVQFVLTCSDGWMRIDVTSSRGTRNAVVFDTTDGRGLVGMRERAALYGGSLEAGPTADDGFRVHAELQCQDAVDEVAST